MAPPRIDAQGASPRAKKVDPSEATKEAPKLSFSFQYWNQMEYFGFSATSMGWLMDFLGQLRNLCGFTKQEFTTEIAHNRGRWHYHRVNWAHPHIPIRRDQLSWLAHDMRDNDEDYEFWQLGPGGAANGRVAGFWERDHRFAIVLLDPHHNLNPSADHGHRVTDCHEAEGSHVRLHLALDRAHKSLRCSEAGCELHKAVADIVVREDTSQADYFSEALVWGIDYDDREKLNELISLGKIRSLHEVVVKGIEKLEEEYLSDE